MCYTMISILQATYEFVVRCLKEELKTCFVLQLMTMRQILNMKEVTMKKKWLTKGSQGIKCRTIST